MNYLAQPTEQLHTFPLPPEAEGFDILEAAQAAAARFDPHVIDMPIEPSEYLSHGDNEVLVMHASSLPSGSFKFLSATNSVAALREQDHDRFVFATAGSFGNAVAEAIDVWGGTPTGIVPLGTSPDIIKNMREHGIDVKEAGGNVDEALAIADQYAEEQEIPRVHPFASLPNVAATALIGLQIARQHPDVTDVVFQYGGGSLATGASAALRAAFSEGILDNEVNITMVQVNGCSPFVDSLRTGTIQEATDTYLNRRSFFQRLGGVGVGKVHPFNLGMASRLADQVAVTTTTDVHATMYEYGRERDGHTPSFAAAVSLEGARSIARLPKPHHTEEEKPRKIVAINTGGKVAEYVPAKYLAIRASRRRANEEYGGKRLR